MGVMPREQDDLYVITSDRTVGDSPSKTAPKQRKDAVYRVWTGDKWSTLTTDAKTFEALEEADDYISENTDRLMNNG